jgi:hypothetical protein
VGGDSCRGIGACNCRLGCEQQKSMVVASWDVVESFLLASPLVNVDLSRIDGWMAASPD